MARTKTITNSEGDLTYITILCKLVADDFAICNETREVIQIAEVLTPEHLYLDVNGEKHYDNFDPWSWHKIIQTNDTDVYYESDQIEWLT